MFIGTIDFYHITSFSASVAGGHIVISKTWWPPWGFVGFFSLLVVDQIKI